MKYWIFKVIYYPVGFIIAMCCMAILGLIIKDVGWEQPFRWLLIIGTIAYFADININR